MSILDSRETALRLGSPEYELDLSWMILGNRVIRIRVAAVQRPTPSPPLLRQSFFWLEKMAVSKIKRVLKDGTMGTMSVFTEEQVVELQKYTPI